MILPVHASLLRIETIRILLATGHEIPEVAEKFGVTRQAIYAAVDRFDLGTTLKPIDRRDKTLAPYLKLALSPDITQKLVDARVMERLLGVA